MVLFTEISHSIGLGFQVFKEGCMARRFFHERLQGIRTQLRPWRKYLILKASMESSSRKCPPQEVWPGLKSKHSCVYILWSWINLLSQLCQIYKRICAGCLAGLLWGSITMTHKYIYTDKNCDCNCRPGSLPLTWPSYLLHHLWG